MYELMVRRDFVAQHYLTVPNCGPENEWHSHHFDLEVILAGSELTDQGYLVDIVAVEDQIDALIERYEDSTLNDLPEFEGLNPSVEHFTRIIAHSLEDGFDAPNVDTLTVRIWEDDQAWASYTLQ